MICHRITGKTGPLCGIALVWPEDDIMLITDSGIIIRTAVGEIPVYGRAASGVIVMRTGDGASIARFARVKPDPDTDTADGEAEYAAEDETDGTVASVTEEE